MRGANVNENVNCYFIIKPSLKSHAIELSLFLWHNTTVPQFFRGKMWHNFQWHNFAVPQFLWHNATVPQYFCDTMQLKVWLYSANRSISDVMTDELTFRTDRRLTCHFRHLPRKRECCPIVFCSVKNLPRSCPRVEGRQIGSWES